MKLKVGVARDAMTIAKATPSRLMATVTASNRRIPLIDFGAPRQTKRGVTANTGQGRQLYPSAFIARMQSGHVGVFKRKGTPRLPIAELHGASVASVAAKYAAAAESRFGDMLSARLVHEIEFELERLRP
jgi:hypothetical protein